MGKTHVVDVNQATSRKSRVGTTSREMHKSFALVKNYREFLSFQPIKQPHFSSADFAKAGSPSAIVQRRSRRTPLSSSHRNGVRAARKTSSPRRAAADT